MKFDFIELQDSWTQQMLDEWRSDKPHRYANYLGIVTRDEEDKEHVRWCERKKGLFSLRGVKKGDILLAGCRDMNKGYSVRKEYYGVVDLTDEWVDLVGATSYRVAKKYLAKVWAEEGGEEE